MTSDVVQAYVDYLETRDRFIRDYCKIHGVVGEIPSEMSGEGSEADQAFKMAYPQTGPFKCGEPESWLPKAFYQPSASAAEIQEMHVSTLSPSYLIDIDHMMPVVVTGRPMRTARTKNWKDGPVHLR